MKLDQIPGPRHWSPFPVSTVFRRDALGYMLQLREKYGEIVNVRMGPRRLVLLFHPDDIEHVLYTKHRIYVRGRGTQKARLFFGRGLFITEGDTWRNQRRFFQPRFNRQELLGSVDRMVETSVEVLERWRAAAATGSPLDMVIEMRRLTLSTVARLLFGQDIGRLDHYAPVFRTILEEITHRATSPLPFPPSIPTPRNRRFRRACDFLDERADEMIAERRERSDPGNDLLGMLVGFRDEHGERMSTTQLRDHCRTFLFAGHETTAVTLAWAVFLLAHHPEIEERLRDEIQTQLGHGVPTVEDLARLPYARMVLQEVLRLYPSAPFVARRTTEHDTIRDYEIPPDTAVTTSSYATHRHPEVWDEPERFDPERFDPRRPRPRRTAYFPFGGGPHVCIGNEFALLEAQVALITAVQKYRFRPDQDRPPDFSVRTVRPQNGLWMRVEPA